MKTEIYAAAPNDRRWELLDALRKCDALFARLLGREPAPVADLAVYCNRLFDGDLDADAELAKVHAILAKVSEIES